MGSVLGLIGVVAVLLIGTEQSHAQRHPERMQLFNPLERSLAEQEAVQWLPGFYGTGAFGKFTGLKDNDHEWHHRLGFAFEVLRWHQRNSLSGITQVSFIYDPNNSINFNPRSAFWEEGLVFTRGYEGFDLQVTLLYRCKHDIDNLNYGTERTTINASLDGRLLFDPWQVGYGRVRLSPGVDLYTITYDDREPEQNPKSGTDWAEMAGVLNLNFTWQRSLNATFNLFLSGYGKMTVYGQDAPLAERYTQPAYVNWNGAVYGGIGISREAHIRVGLKAEHLADSGIPRQPRPADLLSITVKGMAEDVFY